MDLTRLVAWKLRSGWRRVLDGAGGYARLRRRGEWWAAQWRTRVGEEAGSLSRWLTRPGGGRFWFPLGEQAVDWARASCTSQDVAAADAAVSGVFDLLGSGPVARGAEPTWRRDLYSGVEWPLIDAHRIRLVRRDGSDIRTVWEMARCHHFLALARAYWRSGEARYRDTFVRHVSSWLRHNPLGRGPNWVSPMDAALRAANWVLAVSLFAEAEDIPAGFWPAMLGSLFATGLFIERHLEWHPVYRGNHYIADGVGLVYLGTLLRGDADGERWRRAGARLLTTEISRQVGPDGVSFEASLGYHRLVTELFAYGGELIGRNSSEGLPRVYEDRLRGMYRFIAAYLPDTGEAPMLGDADDGRLHATAAEARAAPRRHRLGLPEAWWPTVEPGPAAFPHGGFYVMRTARDHLVVRCGAVGLRGAGSHDHNDQLAFELTLKGRRVVSDSGTYTYTRDLAARHAFRSTAAHSVVQLGDEEQNPISPARPWRVLVDRTRAQCLRWEVTPDHHLFEGQHFGYWHRPSCAICRRRIVAWLADGRWEVVDEVVGRGVESVTWRLHLSPTETHLRSGSDGEREVVLPGDPPVCVRITAAPSLEFTVQESDASDRYGARYRRPCLTLAGRVGLPTSIVTVLTLQDR